MNLDEEDNLDYKLLQKLEDRRYDRFSNTIKTIYGVLSIVFVVVGGLFVYLNATLVSRQEFVDQKTITSKETVAIVEKEGGRISTQISQTLAPVITQVTEMKNKFEDSMDSFSVRINAIERQVDKAKTELDSSTFKTDDFYEFERNNSKALDTIRESIASLQTRLSDLRLLEEKVQDRYTLSQHNQYASAQDLKIEAVVDKTDIAIEKVGSLRKEMTVLIDGLDKRLAALENEISSYKRKK